MVGHYAWGLCVLWGHNDWWDSGLDLGGGWFDIGDRGLMESDLGSSTLDGLGKGQTASFYDDGVLESGVDISVL